LKIKNKINKTKATR